MTGFFTNCISFFMLFFLLSSCGTETTTYILDVDAAPIEGGTVSPSIGQFEEGETVSIIPTPNEDWVFDSWSGDIVSTSNPLEVVIDSDMSVLANFVRKKHPLNLTIIGEGSVDESLISTLKQTDYLLGSIIELTPRPSAGWGFVSWSGDVESTDRTIRVTVQGATNITITFEERTFYLGSNGVTVMCPEAEVGDKGSIYGVEYEAMDRNTFKERQYEFNENTRICTSLITNMSQLFGINHSFSIADWDVSNVTRTDAMFRNIAVPLNESLNHWDVSNVTNMNQMFLGSTYNYPLDNWDVSNVTGMYKMFNSSGFNQPISSWCVKNISSEPEGFSMDSPLTDENKPVWGSCPEN